MAKYENRRRSSLTMGEFLLFAAGTLFCLVLITTAMMGGLLARYTTKAEASDSARVAKFNVGAESLGDVTVSCKDGTSGDYIVTVNNESEVAVSYDIQIIFEEALTEGLSVSLNTDGTIVEPEPSASGDNTITYNQVGTLAPGTSKEHTLQFSVSNWTCITEDVTGPTASKDVSFTVEVTATQID